MRIKFFLLRNYHILIFLISMLCCCNSWAITNPVYIHASGRNLIENGQNFQFKAICFNNNYAKATMDFDTSSHHQAIDYKRVKELGFNSIRFAFNGNWYTDNPEKFWSWMDQNIQWAKQYQLYLILDLHIPVDSFWLDPTSPDVDFSLWEDPSVQQRNIDLWVDIANRYKDEVIIGAYDIINEPVTTDGNGDQWRHFSQRLIDAIRSVDKNHLIVMERLYGVNKKYGTQGIPSQFLVNDDNVVYDFHFYEPIQFTHQNAQWIENPLSDGGYYPDTDHLTPTGLQVLNIDERISSESLKTGTTRWQSFKSDKVTINNDMVAAAMPQMSVRGGASGEVHFDDLRVQEYDPNGLAVREIFYESFSPDSVWQWWDWFQGDKNKNHFTGKRYLDDGYNDESSLSFLLNKLPRDSFGGWSSDYYWIPIKQGYSYQISGMMKGNKIRFNGDKNTFIGFELDFFEHPNQNELGMLPRNAEYLEHHFNKFAKFGIDNNVPMSVLETGAVKDAFVDDKKGGKQWIKDLLAIFEKNNTSFAYWNYHGDQMGLFLSPPDEKLQLANEGLINTFADVLNGKKPVLKGIDVFSENNAPTFIKASSTQVGNKKPYTKEQLPPGDLSIEDTPQFVILSFDDNTLSSGIDWAIDLFSDSKNPVGNNNPKTFDGSSTHASFYMNSVGLNEWMNDDPKALAASVRNLYYLGHEIGNHTDNHQAHINKLPWDEFNQQLATMTVDDWSTRILKAETELTSLAYVPTENMVGFRAPYLRYNDAMFSVLQRENFIYDTSIQEGSDIKFDGTNFRWPYKLVNGSPGHNEGWSANSLNPQKVNVSSYPDLWEIPNYQLIIPDDEVSKRYDIKPGLRKRIAKNYSDFNDYRITNFDYNLWVSAKLNKKEFVATLKYNLDLRLEGNRAPFTLGLHSQYYTDEAWVKKNAPQVSAEEMRSAIKEFLEYALSKPDVRVRPAIDLIDWLEKPVGLVSASTS